MLKSLTYTTLFPNPAQHSHAVFVERRIMAMADRICCRVIAPVNVLLGLQCLKKIPRKHTQNLMEIYHPRYLCIPKLFKGWDGFFLYYCTKKSAVKIINKYRPDFIDAHYAYPDGFAAMLLAKATKIPFFVTIRGSDIYILAKDKSRRSRIQETLQKARGIVAVSESLKKLAMSLGVVPDKISVISNGVNKKIFCPQINNNSIRSQLRIPSTAFLTLGVGRLVEVKRFDLLIRIVARLNSNGLNAPIHGIIVGDGPQMSKLLALARELNLQDKMHFVGQQRPELLPEFYNAADMLFVLSTHEGSPNAPIEALSCGTPVVATEVGNLPEIISPRNGLLVTDLKEENVAASIISFFDNFSGTRNSISESVAEYTWESTTRKQVSFIETMLQVAQ